MGEVARSQGKIVLVSVGLGVAAGGCAALIAVLWRWLGTAERPAAAPPKPLATLSLAAIGVFVCWFAGVAVEAFFGWTLDYFFDGDRVPFGAGVVGGAQTILGVVTLWADLSSSWLWLGAAFWAAFVAVAAFAAGQREFLLDRRK
ncbi:hypothetical protein LFM09_01150 [Lentzea alba]|uniref:hypothetical protein n=1 Tax=Lentzea alba TaxID=2714351 RepID=UPI0039BF0968